ncbi:tRNA(Met) cytidine acetyltransferase TmcA [Halovivax sp.]|uniref:tRNA(Met) cytidine acetyltransferase TmcA n=1 Tax=Halovivax sp. TaxID=1935978 RepID=UPI0025BCFD49|nr:tRNA(Met) cytidine acetyltransferase TmcA [Halovivax sp.]
MDPVAVAQTLREEARAVDERRLLVLAGDRERAYPILEEVLDALDAPITGTTLVGPEDRLRCERVPQPNADRLLGTTRKVVILDAHDEFRPNALGSIVGTVDGGGLLILLTPPLDEWPKRRDAFDERLAAPPYEIDAVTGRFRDRLVETLRTHPGIAILDVDEGRVVRNGLAHPAPRLERSDRPSESPGDGVFPPAAREACLTRDQLGALRAFEALAATGSEPRAVVLEADRGRGKSSAAGLAAGSLAAAGRDVVVTAAAFDNAAEAFARARELLDALEALDDEASVEDVLRARSGGRVRFEPAADVDDWIGDPDVAIVDEAASLPVSLLEATLATDRVAYATTVHGYEGAGRGFSVRFRDRLAEADHDVTAYAMAEPIRYAAGDPIETWAFRALLLDARPPAEPLIEDARPETVAYRALDPDELRADEHRLREAFGLLVLAHYRTEPDDLARLLDAPNLEARALLHDGHVASVALLAREGGLDAETRAEMYEGGRIRGNMIPDVLTSQLRDEAAGKPVGYRIVRIATHHAVRSRGLGSHLLERIREEFAPAVDWLGSGFGATPELLEFWRENGYGAVHASTTRNDRSGEYSAIVLSPTSEAGSALRDRHARWFARRIPAVAGDALSDVDPDVARALLRTVAADDSVEDPVAPALDLTDHEWRLVAGAAYGPGLFDVDPGPFRPPIVRYFLDGPADVGLTAREERLLVRRALQAQPWPAVADELGYHSPGQCMRSFGDALVALVDRYGDEAARAVRDRFAEG